MASKLSEGQLIRQAPFKERVKLLTSNIEELQSQSQKKLYYKNSKLMDDFMALSNQLALTTEAKSRQFNALSDTMSQIRETIEMQKCEGQQVLQQVQQFVHLLQKQTERRLDRVEKQRREKEASLDQQISMNMARLQIKVDNLKCRPGELDCQILELKQIRAEVSAFFSDQQRLLQKLRTDMLKAIELNSKAIKLDLLEQQCQDQETILSFMCEIEHQIVSKISRTKQDRERMEETVLASLERILSSCKT